MNLYSTIPVSATISEMLTGISLFGWYPFVDMNWWTYLLIAADVIIKIWALGYVPRNRRPSSAIGWLLAIFLIPFLGLIVFLFIGSPFVHGRRHKIQELANGRIREFTADQPDVPEGFTLKPLTKTTVDMNRQLTAFPATTGRMLDIYTKYTDGYQGMIEEIDKAKESINVVFYITSWDDTTDAFFQALRRAMARGVEVRYMFDQVGSWKYPHYRQLGKKLDAIGVKWHGMLPISPGRRRFLRPDLRNHRKLLVVDNTIGFMGSQNLIDSSYDMKANKKIGRHWVDLWTKLEGPIVTELSMVFATDWLIESGEQVDFPSHDELDETPQESSSRAEGTEFMQLVPSGPGYKTEPNLRMFNSMVYNADKKLTLVSPYFIPDESLMASITSARFRGVEVELFVSEKSDQALVGHAQASYYEQLLRAGVRIWQYPAPYVLHTKFGLSDHNWAFMGSSNMDMRSFGLNYEISLMTLDGPMIEHLQEVAQGYKEVSTELSLEEWMNRPVYQKYLDNLARLTSALL